jgi:hypothetical protein
MASPYSNLRSKCDRAIVAMLVGEHCGSGANILPYAVNATKTYPNATIHSVSSIPDPSYSGNRWVKIQIEVKGSAAIDPAFPASQQGRVGFDNMVALIGDAMLQSSNNGQDLQATCDLINQYGRALAVDPTNGANPVAAQSALDNADMVDFTALVLKEGLEGDGTIEADEEGCSWCEILTYELLACPSNVS